MFRSFVIFQNSIFFSFYFVSVFNFVFNPVLLSTSRFLTLRYDTKLFLEVNVIASVELDHLSATRLNTARFFNVYHQFNPLLNDFTVGFILLITRAVVVVALAD